jgi:hypothetical protein
MTQQPSQNKQVLAKLDEIVRDVGEVKEQISSMKKQIEMQPIIDQGQHKAQDERIGQTERRVKQLEDNQRWIIIAVFGAIINAIMQLILH